MGGPALGTQVWGCRMPHPALQPRPQPCTTHIYAGETSCKQLCVLQRHGGWVACSSLQGHALPKKRCFMLSHQMLADLWESRQLTDIMAQAHTRKVFSQDLQPGKSCSAGLGLLDSLLGSCLLEAWQLCFTCCAPGSDSHCKIISCPACTADKVCSASSIGFCLIQPHSGGKCHLGKGQRILKV